jgi:hypothetical protein
VNRVDLVPELVHHLRGALNIGAVARKQTVYLIKVEEELLLEQILKILRNAHAGKVCPLLLVEHFHGLLHFVLWSGAEESLQQRVADTMNCRESLVAISQVDADVLE